jgi:signal transduction histidine kinase
VVNIVLARPRAYGNIDIPTLMRTSRDGRTFDIRFNQVVTLAGLKAGENEVVISSLDLPKPVHVRIFVEPTITETGWFWVTLVLIVGTLVGFLLRYRRQLKLYRRAELERTATMERAKISQDLHDAVGSDLVRMNMILNRTDQDIPREELSRIAREANRTLRDIIWTSKETQTVDAVVAALAERIRTIATEVNLALDLALPDALPTHPMPPERVRDLVLIITECITNIIKHAQATVVHANVGYSNSTLHITVADNGVGIQSAGTNRGMGLPGMRQRAERSGMTLVIQSTSDSGTTLELIVPFEGVT